MIPRQHDTRSPARRHLIEIPFGTFALATVSLPFFGFIFCVVWSVLYFYERSTATHCGVANYLPSISAAIGNYQPQRFVWQTAILLHALPRFLIAHEYLRFNKNRIRRNRKGLAYLAYIVNVIENIVLVGLSLWTSSDDYEVHKFCFMTFIIASECYMLISYVINRHSRKIIDSATLAEQKSIRFKRIFLSVNIVAFWFAGYFFMRHNWYCETGVYTLFALMEYVVVLTNMGFHMCSYFDFNSKKIVCDCFNGFQMVTANQYSRLDYY